MAGAKRRASQPSSIQRGSDVPETARGSADHAVSVLDAAPSGEVDRASDHLPSEGVETVATRSLHARARETFGRGNSNTPLGDAMRAWLRTNPDAALGVYVEALSATKWDKGLGEIPDYAVRMRAAEGIANRAEGMPTQRTELTGAAGGPIALAAALIDPGQTV